MPIWKGSAYVWHESDTKAGTSHARYVGKSNWDHDNLWNGMIEDLWIIEEVLDANDVGLLMNGTYRPSAAAAEVDEVGTNDSTNDSGQKCGTSRTGAIRT